MRIAGTGTLVLLAWIAIGTGCEKKPVPLESCAYGRTGCQADDKACSVALSCQDSTVYELKCDVSSHAPPFSCQCLHNGVVEKSATIGGKTDWSRATVSVACGWPAK